VAVNSFARAVGLPLTTQPGRIGAGAKPSVVAAGMIFGSLIFKDVIGSWIEEECEAHAAEIEVVI
jgi:hypothetical protein